MAIQYGKAPFQLLDAIFPRLSARLALQRFVTPRRWPMPAWEQEIAERAKAIALADGYSGWSWGKGRTVLLVHGWEGRVTQLGRFIEPLTGRGFRVIGFNAPAHGEQPGKALNVVEYGRFLQRIVAEHAPLHGVIAHSMGASAFAFAARAPLPVERAVLISPANSVAGVVQRFEDLLDLSARTRSLLRQRLERKIFNGPLAELDLSARVPKFLPPVLLLATNDDQDVPIADTQRLALHWPNAHMKIAPRAGGHRKLLRDARAIEAAVRFLAEDAWIRQAPNDQTAPRRRAGEVARAY